MTTDMSYHYTGSNELPIFPEVLSSPFDLAEVAQQSGNQTMRRAVRIGTTPETVGDLEDLIALGEDHFAALARAGLPVVPHTWGLTPMDAVPERRHYEFIDYAGHCLPEGYFLAAEVHSVAEQAIPPADRLKPLTATSSYRRSAAVEETGYQLVEIGSTYGTLRSCPASTTPKFWMHDIDLYFQRA